MKVERTTKQTPEGVILIFRIAGEEMVVNVNDYESGAAIQKDVLAWAKPFGGTRL